VTLDAPIGGGDALLADHRDAHQAAPFRCDTTRAASESESRAPSVPQA
jgi:hypothetical protein